MNNLKKDGNKNLNYFNANFFILQSVGDLGAELQKQYSNLYILISLAGIRLRKTVSKPTELVFT